MSTHGSKEKMNCDIITQWNTIYSVENEGSITLYSNMDES